MPAASAACSSGIVASISSNDRVGACARPCPTRAEPISNTAPATTGISRPITLRVWFMFGLRRDEDAGFDCRFQDGNDVPRGQVCQDDRHGLLLTTPCSSTTLVVRARVVLAKILIAPGHRLSPRVGEAIAQWWSIAGQQRGVARAHASDKRLILFDSQFRRVWHACCHLSPAVRRGRSGRGVPPNCDVIHVESSSRRSRSA